ncbi:MAG: aminopeptidase P family N-terminal domain-containing protein, partial [Oscillospiraceae bacterium]|nr:aminopeptidase P family N-terminal domain-containing protein [Oscillospiraceae bacterium]
MSDIAGRLQSLREQMKKNGITMYYIPSDDFHGSEYVSGYFKSREYISGFTGSAGEVIVTQDNAWLWTDGRYFIQAEKQLSGTEYILNRAGEP